MTTKPAMAPPELTECPVCHNTRALLDILAIKRNGPCYVAICGPCGTGWVLGTVGPAQRSPSMQERYREALHLSMAKGDL